MNNFEDLAKVTTETTDDTVEMEVTDKVTPTVEEEVTQPDVSAEVKEDDDEQPEVDTEVLEDEVEPIHDEQVPEQEKVEDEATDVVEETTETKVIVESEPTEMSKETEQDVATPEVEAVEDKTTEEQPEVVDNTQSVTLDEQGVVETSEPEEQPEPEEPVEQPKPAEPKDNSAVLDKLLGSLSSLEEKFDAVQTKIDEFEAKSKVTIPEVKPVTENGDVEVTGEPRAVQVAEETQEGRPAISDDEDESVVQPDIDENQDTDEPDISSYIDSFTNAFKELAPELSVDERDSYRRAIRHISQGEGTEKDATTVANILSRFSEE